MFKLPYVGMFLNVMFSPVLTLNPVLSLTLISIFLSLLTFSITKILLKRSKLTNLKKQVEEIRKNIIRLQKEKNEEKIKEEIENLMNLNKLYLKNSLKMIGVSLLILFLFFPWIQENYQAMYVQLPFKLPLIGGKINWFEWYIFVSVIVGFAIKKILG